MKPLFLLSLLASLSIISCGTKVAQHKPKRPALPADASATQVAMHRQVHNAELAVEGDFELKTLRQRLLSEPRNLGLRLQLARRYESLGYTELAVEHFRLAADQFPDDPAVRIALARCLRGAGELEQAVQSLDAFISRNPNASAEVYAWNGILHDESSQFELGERSHRVALERSKPKAWLRNNLGQNLLAQGRREEAAAEFRAALKLEPRNELARNNLGVALAADPREAVLHLQSVADPSTAHNNLAAVLIEQHRYKEARQELNLALGYRPNNRAALNNLALLSELDGQPAAFKPEKHKLTRSASKIDKSSRP